MESTKILTVRFGVILIVVMVMVMMEDDRYGCGDAGDDVGGGESGSQGQ